MTRTTPAFSDKYTAISGDDRMFFYVGKNSPRWVWRKDADGVSIHGTLLEPAVENRCLQSRDMATTWTSVALTSITSNGLAGIDGTSYMDGIVGTAVDTQHGLTQAVTVTAVENVFSVVAEKGNKDWIKLENATIANGTAYFDIANGTIGTIGAGFSDSWLEQVDTGLWLAAVRFTGTAAAHTFGLYSAHADEDDDFAGDASTVNTWFGDAQIEIGRYPSSRIGTTTGEATRAADSAIQHDLDVFLDGQQFAYSQEILAPDFLPGADILFAEISDGGTNSVKLYAAQTTGYLKIVTASDGESAGACTVDKIITDNKVHRIAVSAKPNQLQAWVDDTAGTADTDVGISNAMDRVLLGPNLGCVHGEVKLDNLFTGEPWAKPFHGQDLVHIGGL